MPPLANSLTPPKKTEIPLWDHQWNALEKILAYVEAFNAGKTDKSCLVNMPTGTGKTGVMAVAALLVKGIGSTLLLTPRIALREQAAKELRGAFFKKLKIAKPDHKKTILEADSWEALKNVTLTETAVVTTIQLLHSVAGNNQQILEALHQAVDLVIIDEGHYEPAVFWSESIRSIKKPRVIFTATPFRNDLKLFDFDPDHIFSYSYQAGVKDRVIRKIELHKRTENLSPAAFVKDVVNFYDEALKADNALSAEKPRVIIRCDTHATIRKIGAALAGLNRTYVLIHENFKDGGTVAHERRSVPKPDNEPAIFWVHQFKLLEGIDDQRFRFLAIYEELETTRQVVQQAGRVIRNPSRNTGQVAHFLDHSGGLHSELWKDFLEFDALVESEGLSLDSSGKAFLQAITRGLKAVIYYDKRFRTPFSIESLSPMLDLVLSPSVNVLAKKQTWNFERVLTTVASELVEHDREIRTFTIDKRTSLIVYIALQNSPLLKTKYFPEPRLGVFLLQEQGDFIFAHDSAGSIPEAVLESAKPLATKELRRLFAHTKANITFVNLRNSNLAKLAVRVRGISAANLADTVPAFDDHSFVCSAARGSWKKNDGTHSRRYVGFESARISDAVSRRLGIAEFLDWLDALSEQLKQKNSSAPAFSRFALSSEVPAKTKPMSVLLDVSDVESHFLTTAGNGIEPDEPMLLEDCCADVKNGEFAIKANGITCDCKLSFSVDSSRYTIESPALERLYYSNDGAVGPDLVKYLNRSQMFRVIPEEDGFFYVLGQFHKPGVTFGPTYDDDQVGILRVLHKIDCLKNVGSEKGKTTLGNAGWQSDSLFGLIDSLGKGSQLEPYFGTPDILVCDDMETEAADFILANSSSITRRVVFIHAKGKGEKQSKYGASPLQEVCGQATKNMKYLLPFCPDSPDKCRKWHNAEWKGGKHVQGNVKNRIRLPNKWSKTGLDLWQEIRTTIKDPLADKEVWLLLGKILSKDEFSKQLTKSDPSPEAMQAAFLILSTMNAVAACGAKLRVFCGP